MKNLGKQPVPWIAAASLALCLSAHADELKARDPVFYFGCGTVTGLGKIIQLEREGNQLGRVDLPNCPYGVSWNGREIVAAIPRAGEVVGIDGTGVSRKLFEVGHPIDVAARNGQIIVTDNLANVVLMSSGMAGDKQLRTLSTFFRSGSLQSISVALTRDDRIIIGTNRPSGIYRLGEDEEEKIGKPLLPMDGEVAADLTSNRWVACQPTKLHVFEKDRAITALLYPKGTGPYRGGIVAFGSGGGLYATLKTKTGVELFRVDVTASSFHPLFQWKGERLVDFAVGSRMEWPEKE